MPQALSQVALLVRNYDEAIAFFTDRLRFVLLEDCPVGGGKRWVRVAPPGGGTALLLAWAATPEQESRIGDQTGGRVFLFLHTDDFWRDYHELRSRGITFAEEPRHEAYGTVAVFLDLYGNRWDLVQPQPGPDGPLDRTTPPTALTQNKALVRRYYAEMWNRWAFALADELIDEGIVFRGSLGVSVHGREGFKGYMHMVRAAFPDFHNQLEDLVAEGDRVVARLTYTGTHTGELFGVAGTGRRVSYAGVAVFRAAGGRVVEGWVLGDIEGLLRQLRGVNRK